MKLEPTLCDLVSRACALTSAEIDLMWQTAPHRTPSRRQGVSPPPSPKRPPKRWRDLILRVWHVDLLRCPTCQNPMWVIALIDDPREVERILRHLAAWHDPPAGLSPPGTARPYTYQLCDAAAPILDYENVLADCEPFFWRAVWSRASAWHRPFLAQFTTEPRHLSRISWPLGGCRPPTPLALGQNRQKTGKTSGNTCLLTPSASSGRIGPQWIRGKSNAPSCAQRQGQAGAPKIKLYQFMLTKNAISIRSIPHASSCSGLSLLKSLILSSRRRWRANLIMAGAAFAWLVGVASSEAASLDSGPQMSLARMDQYTLQLPDGRVALLGGHGTGFVSLNSMDLWSPASNSFTSVALPFVYDMGALVRLSNGSYLMAGGAADLGVAPGYATAQILVPASATVTTTGTTMVRARMFCNGAQLTGGKVLIVGGWYDNPSATYGEIFDPASMGFSATGPLNTPRAMPLVYPTADGKAVVVGGLGVYGSPNISSVELYDPASNGFSVLAPSVITGDTNWTYGNAWYAQDSDQSKTADGRYVFLMSRTVVSGTEYALGLFDPAAKQFSKLALTPAFWNGYGILPPVVDATNNRALFLVGANQNGGANLTFRVFQVDLATGQALALSDWLSVTNYYPGSAGITLLGDGRLFVTGGTTSIDYNFNFNPVPNTFFLSGLTPPPLIQSVGVSGGLVSLSLRGGVGVTYEIQSLPALGTSTNWQTLGSLALTNSVQTWSDPAPATNFSRFYRLQGP